jgi:hypothetical protein
MRVSVSSSISAGDGCAASGGAGTWGAGPCIVSAAITAGDGIGSGGGAVVGIRGGGAVLGSSGGGGAVSAFMRSGDGFGSGAAGKGPAPMSTGLIV